MRENNDGGLTIIVADDSSDIRQMLRFMLELRGYRVLEAGNGQEAVELAQLGCPDLILMDLNMPVLDGLTATRRLREHEEMCRVPIVAISANGKQSCHAAALAAGCNECLTKPVSLHELDHLLHRLLAA
jgi:CheY-like chemotaxis protein